MIEYRDVCQQIIETTEDNIGEVAIRQAEQAGLTIEDGKVETADKDDLTSLLDAYTDIMGPGAYAHARYAVKELYDKDTSVKDLDLPEEILPATLKADKFASAL